MSTNKSSVSQTLVENNEKLVFSVKKSRLLVALAIIIIILGVSIYLLDNSRKSSTIASNPIVTSQVNKQYQQFQNIPPSPTGTICTNPNEQKVVFSRSGDIWIVNFDGTCLRELTNYGKNFQPQLSPNGDKLVYYSVDAKIKGFPEDKEGTYDNTGTNIWSINTNGTNPVEITQSNTLAHRSNLSWSPSGNQIMYTEDEKIVVVNPDGTNKKVITNLNNIPNVLLNTKNPGGYPITYYPPPIWSPNGNQIAITTYTPDDSGKIGEGYPNFTQILLFDLNGNLLNRYANALQDIAYWSPTNNKIYTVDSGNGIGDYGLEAVSLDGSDKTLISGVAEANYSVGAPVTSTVKNSGIWGALGNIAVSKDGTKIATVRVEGYDQTKGAALTTIWIMNIDGSNPHAVHLADNIFGMGQIQWLPDNAHLIFTASQIDFSSGTTPYGSLLGLYSVSSNGSNLTSLDPPHPFNPEAPFIINDDEFSTGVLPNQLVVLQ